MTGEERSWLQRFIIWREKNVKEKRFILVLSFWSVSLRHLPH